jgi:hypothetical protein
VENGSQPRQGNRSDESDLHTVHLIPRTFRIEQAGDGFPQNRAGLANAARIISIRGQARQAA